MSRRQKILLFLPGVIIILVLAAFYGLSSKSVLVKTGGGAAGKKARVAIVIDDVGLFNPIGFEDLLALDTPLTFAVLPNQENTEKHASIAVKRGQEIIVHLPMQPVKGKANWLGSNAITSDMTPEEIRLQVKQDFDKLPQAKGFNNHMGSLITSREDLVIPILEVARDKGYFVLDSKTTGKSKLVPLARAMGIAYVERDIFLDNVKTTAYVMKQLNRTARIALDRGSAVAIGHVGLGGDKTARAIKEMIPVMESRGIEFVHLSDLVVIPSSVFSF